MSPPARLAAASAGSPPTPPTRERWSSRPSTSGRPARSTGPPTAARPGRRWSGRRSGTWRARSGSTGTATACRRRAGWATSRSIPSIRRARSSSPGRASGRATTSPPPTAARRRTGRSPTMASRRRWCSTSPARRRGAPLLSGVGDIAGFRHDDLDVSPADGMFGNPIFGNTTSLDFAESAPNIVARVGTNSSPAGARRLLDGRRDDLDPVRRRPHGEHGSSGSIAVSADGKTFVWAPAAGHAASLLARQRHHLDRRAWGSPRARGWPPTGSTPRSSTRSGGNRMYVSTDGGATFTPATAPAAGRPRPVFGVEGDVWVATEQRPASFAGLGRDVHAGAAGDRRDGGGLRNAGARAEPIRPSTCAGVRRHGAWGTYRSDDAGATWQRIDDPQHQFGYINCLGRRPAPVRPRLSRHRRQGDRLWRSAIATRHRQTHKGPKRMATKASWVMSLAVIVGGSGCNAGCTVDVLLSRAAGRRTPAAAAAAGGGRRPPAAAAAARPVGSVAYNWKNVVILGGGFVSGIVFSPVEKDLVYARTDVGGAYRWNPADKTWIAAHRPPGARFELPRHREPGGRSGRRQQGLPGRRHVHRLVGRQRRHPAFERSRQHLEGDRHAHEDGRQRERPLDGRAAGHRPQPAQHPLLRLAQGRALEERGLGRRPGKRSPASPPPTTTRGSASRSSCSTRRAAAKGKPTPIIYAGVANNDGQPLPQHRRGRDLEAGAQAADRRDGQPRASSTPPARCTSATETARARTTSPTARSGSTSPRRTSSPTSRRPRRRATTSSATAGCRSTPRTPAP